MYDVPSAVLSFSKTPSTPSVAQGVLARDDVMTLGPVKDRCFNTGMVDSALPVSVKADSVISGASVSSSSRRMNIQIVEGMINTTRTMLHRRCSAVPSCPLDQQISVVLLSWSEGNNVD